MGIYEELGVTPIINLWGTATRLGGALMAPEVVDAMAEASKESVKMDELQAAANRIIAELTGAEAGYVTCGASSALLLGTAACLAGLDPARMERLPNTHGMPNQVIMSRYERCGYDHAIRAAGAEIVDVGYDESVTGSIRPVEPWEYEAAITPDTAAIALIAYVWQPKHEDRYREAIRVAHKHRLPVLVDAAASVPPVENFRRFIEMGADLVAFSGGKAIRGPQNTGILCGRKDLIASVALQHLDAGGFSELWNPPEALIPKEKILGQPRQGIGRAQKVSKEALVGLIARLRRLSLERTVTEARSMYKLLEKIRDGIHDIPSVETMISSQDDLESGSVPVLKLKIDPKGLGQNAVQVTTKLRNGNPRLWVNEKSLRDNILLITAINLDDTLAEVVRNRFREVFLGES